MSFQTSKTFVALFLLCHFLLVQGASFPKPRFSDAPDPLDLKGGDYYDEKQYPEIRGESRLYIRRPPGGVTTVRPIVRPNIPPDVEPINNLKSEGSLLKVGRVQGKALWAEKTEERRVNTNKLEVKTENMGRTVKGVVIDVKNLVHRGYRVMVRVDGNNHWITLLSSDNRPMTGKVKIQYYTNPPWKRNQGNKKKGKKPGAKKQGN